MQQTDTPVRSSRRTRAVGMGMVAVLVGACAIAGGSAPAFAASSTAVANFSQLSDAFGTAGVSEIDVTQNIQDNATGVLVLAPNLESTPANTILDLQGHEVDVKRIQLTSVDDSAKPVGASLTVVDSRGGGLLKVDNSASTGQEALYAAIEVDQDAGSSLSIQGASVTALASTASTANAAAIGGGTWSGLSGAAGTISVTDYNGGIQPTVTAVGSVKGAAIGAGAGAGGASIVFAGHATIVASAPGTASAGAAAIGGGDSPANGHTQGPSIAIQDYAEVTADSSGAGAAIGGGRFGAGGSVTIDGNTTVIARGGAGQGQAGIGDGARSSNGLTTAVAISGAADVTAVGGGGGGAAIGGASNSYGGDSVTIGAGATVQVSATAGVTAIGAPNGAGVGTLANNGRLVLASGSTLAVPATGDPTATTNSGRLINNGVIVVPAGATLTNAAGAILDNKNGTISGTGAIQNDGSILQPSTSSRLSIGSISGNAFDLVYDPQAGTVDTGEQFVYAPTVALAGFPVPEATPNSAGQFSGWNAQPDGSDHDLRGTTSITDLADSASGSLVRFRVYALYQLDPVLPTGPALKQAVLGSPYSASVGVTVGSAPLHYTYLGGLPTGLSLDPATGAITGTPTTYGHFEITVTVTNAANTDERTYTLEAVPAPIAVSVPSAPKGAPRYLAGSPASVRITNLQANENWSIKIGGRVAASGTATSNLPFTKAVTVPLATGDGLQTVEVSGGLHATAGTAKILTAAVAKTLGVKLSATKIKYGKKLTVTVSKLYPGERTTVVFSGKHSKSAVTQANSAGTAVVSISTLAKGTYTVKVTGAGTSRKASVKLTVS